MLDVLRLKGQTLKAGIKAEFRTGTKMQALG
jgi:hypothetical protein